MTHHTLPIDVGHVSHIGRVRKVNEDYLRVYTTDEHVAQGARLFVIADGVGGQSHGDVASRIAVEAAGMHFYHLMTSHQPASVTPEIMRETLGQANGAVFEAALSRGAAGHMATTMVVAALRGSELTVGWVGDSRAYILRRESPFIDQITSDHSRVQELVRAGKLAPYEAHTHPRRNILTRSIGGLPEVEVDVASDEVDPGDIVILCTDGLSNSITDEELADGARNAPYSETAARNLVELANARGGRDNISVIVLHIGLRDVVDYPEDDLPIEPMTLPEPKSAVIASAAPPPPTMLDDDEDDDEVVIRPLPQPAWKRDTQPIDEEELAAAVEEKNVWGDEPFERWLVVGAAVLVIVAALSLAYGTFFSGGSSSDDDPPPETIMPADASSAAEAEDTVIIYTVVPPTTVPDIPATETAAASAATLVASTEAAATSLAMTSAAVPVQVVTPVAGTARDSAVVAPEDDGIFAPLPDWLPGTGLVVVRDSALRGAPDPTVEGLPILAGEPLIVSAPEGGIPWRAVNQARWWYVRTGDGQRSGWIPEASIDVPEG